MGKKKITIGIIGCGHWGPNYIRAFQRIKNVSLEIACDLDKKNLKSIRNKYPHIKTTSDSNKIIKNSSFDAVIIATPAKTHYSLVKRCLLARKHIILNGDINQEKKQRKN